jgi:hypothetical protein
MLTMKFGVSEILNVIKFTTEKLGMNGLKPGCLSRCETDFGNKVTFTYKQCGREVVFDVEDHNSVSFCFALKHFIDWEDFEFLDIPDPQTGYPQKQFSAVYKSKEDFYNGYEQFIKELAIKFCR